MANTYDTSGEPLGSKAPKVLYNNASNLDDAMNSTLPSWTDRPPFNRQRLTLWGAEQQWYQWLQNSGYESVHLTYVDGVPLVVDRPTQLIDRAGSVYRVKLPESFPLTLTGNWATDQAKLLDVGDSALRQDLASSDPAKGASLVRGATRTVGTVATLRAASAGGLFDGDVVNLAAYASDALNFGSGLLRWDSASVEADDGFLVFKVTSVTNGRWKRVDLNDLDVGHAGAKPGTDCATAVNAMLAAGYPVVFPSGGLFKLSTSVTTSRNSEMRFAKGAQLTIDTGITLTHRGTFSAQPQQIFFGAGIVVGIRNVVPEWWGATQDGSTDSLAAFNSAFACMALSTNSEGPRQSFDMAGGATYELSAPWVVTPTASCNFHIRGAGIVFGGTRIRAGAGFPASPVIVVNGSSDTIARIADFKITDFGVIVPSGNAANVGVQIGNTSSAIQLSGLQQNLVENIFIGFEGSTGANKTGLLVCHARLVTFRRCSVWMDQLTGVNNTCVRFQVQGAFTGDLRFDGCQFVPSTFTGNYCVRFEATGGAFGVGINQLAGIKFAGTDFYSADVKVYGIASLGSRLSDIWFMPGCQWDGNSNSDVYLESTWAGGVGTRSLVDNIHIDGCFLFGGNLDPGKAQITVTSTGSGGAIREIFVNDCIIGSAVGPSILIADNALGQIEGIHITDSTFRDTSSPDSCVEIHGRRVVCTGNQANRFSTAAPQHLIRLASGSTACIVKDNIGVGVTVLAAVVNDAGTSTNIVSDNL